MDSKSGTAKEEVEGVSRSCEEEGEEEDEGDRRLFRFVGRVLENAIIWVICAI